MIVLPEGRLPFSLFIKPSPSPYDSEQIRQWLAFIKYPSPIPPVDKFPVDLESLTLLLRLSLIAFPIDNTPMHYSRSHLMDVSPQGVFKRLIQDKRGGSYCFGLNGLFLGMLRGLRFRAYGAAGRVNEQYENGPNAPLRCTSLQHFVVFVQPLKDSPLTTYLVDAGFGGSGSVWPMLLSEDRVQMGTTPTEKHRLVRGSMPESSLALSASDDAVASTNWILQVSHKKPNSTTTEEKWRTMYAVNPLTEYFPLDTDDASYVVSTRLQRHFTDEVICCRNFWISPEQAERAGIKGEGFIGRLTLAGKGKGRVRRHIGPMVEEVETLTTEQRRVEALRDLFGIIVDDVDAIRGTDAALLS